MTTTFIRATDMTMIEQLKHLETIILEVRKQYHITATELVNLKNKTKSDIQSATHALQTQLDNTKHENNQLKHQLQNKSNVYEKLEQALSELKQEHISMSERFAELKEQVNYLQTQNQELQQKNLIATEHSKNILAQLQQIEQSN